MGSNWNTEGQDNPRADGGHPRIGEWVILLHNVVELGQLIQKQDALMGERVFARPGARPAADQCRERGRMMRVSKRPLARQPAAAQPARQFQRLRY